MSDNSQIVYAEDFTEDVEHQRFINCDCTKAIYSDVESFFHDSAVFIDNYHHKIKTGKFTAWDVIADPFNRELPICKLLLDILDVIQNFDKHFIDDAFEQLMSAMEHADNGTVQTTVLYDPRERDWYSEECHCPLQLHDHDKNPINTVDCCTINLRTIVTSQLITFLYNFITQDDIIPLVLELIKDNKPLRKVFRDNLLSYHKQFIYCHAWKGGDYYFRKMFRKSIYLADIPIGIEELYLKKMENFEAQICGHPLASNGWMNEDWEEYQEMYEEHNTQITAC